MNAILQDREERYRNRLKLVAQYRKPLLTMGVNYPGSKKNNSVTSAIFKDMLEVIEGNFSLQKKWIKDSAAGRSLTVLIDDSPYKIKQKAIVIEESHPLGRLIDIDVYSTKGVIIGRDEEGLPPRRCFICTEPAMHCVRERRHPLEEAQRAFAIIFQEYFAPRIVAFAIQSLVEELSLHPKPGLVTPYSQGAHTDMDFALMSCGINALEEPFLELAHLAFRVEDRKELFRRAREIGIWGEERLFLATAGVNTHRGALFLQGLLMINFILTLKRDGTLLDLKKNIRAMCAGVERELQLPGDPSHGKEAFRESGVGGIRSAAVQGFPDLFSFFKEKEPLRILFLLMAQCDDTTIIHRGGLTALKYVKEKAIEGLSTENLHEYSCELDTEFKAKNLSPGGSADLLGGCFFLQKAAPYLLRE